MRAISTRTGNSEIELAKFPKDFLTVLNPQVQIENGQVRHLFAEYQDGLLTIMDKVHSLAFWLQPTAQEEPGRFIVFGDQYSRIRAFPKILCELRRQEIEPASSTARGEVELKIAGREETPRVSI